jgi:hypothetical protein
MAIELDSGSLLMESAVVRPTEERSFTSSEKFMRLPILKGLLASILVVTSQNAPSPIDRNKSEGAYQRFLDARNAFLATIDVGSSEAETLQALQGENLVDSANPIVNRENPRQEKLRQFRCVAHDDSVFVACVSLDVNDQSLSRPPQTVDRIVVLTASEPGLVVAADVIATAASEEALSRFVGSQASAVPKALRGVYQDYVKANHLRRVSVLLADGWWLRPNATFKTDPYNRGLVVLPSVDDHARASWSPRITEFRVLATTGDAAIAWARVVGTWDLTFKEPVNADVLQRVDTRDSVVIMRRIEGDSWQVVQEVRVR